MSAIAGIYHSDGRTVHRSQMENMLATLAHRGPDGNGMWRNGSVGLGHHMLHTTPESAREKLPVQKNGLVITADARIDNREELLARLGPPERNCMDGELILSAYEKWGEACAEKLLGDFAFAIWDSKKRQLFCARDHFGVKPFYYHHDGRVFAFASEIKGILALQDIPRQLNEVRVADYLLKRFDDKEITFYRHIRRLQPGHCATVSRAGMHVQCFWSADASHELRLTSDADYAAAFREIFSDAVRCRLRTAFRVGCFLSGGLDSSSIACVAQRQNGHHKVPTFSATFDGVPQCDERTFIDKIVQQGGFEPHFVPADRLSPLIDLQQMFWHQDEAFYAPNLFIHWGLYRSAHEANVRVLLDGLDGDTTVSHGTHYLSELAVSGRWLTLASELRGVAKYFNRSPPEMLRHYLWNFGIKTRLPSSFRQKVRGRIPAKHSGNDLLTTLNPEFVRRLNLEDRLQENGRKPRTERQEHHQRLKSGLISFALEVADRAAAAFAIEPRYPFFDKRLVEFCLALPPQQKLNRGWTRIVLRRAMQGILPPEIQWRPTKTNLSANFNRALLTFEENVIKETILKDGDLIAHYVNMPKLREACHRYLASGNGDDALTVWRTVTLALWLNRTRLLP